MSLLPLFWESAQSDGEIIRNSVPVKVPVKVPVNGWFLLFDEPWKSFAELCGVVDKRAKKPDSIGVR